MSKNYFVDPKWSEALTLRERIALVREFEPQTTTTTLDTEFAERHLQRWRSQYPFTIDSYYNEWLDLNGLDQDEFLNVLGAPIEHLHNRLPAEPEWLTELQRAFPQINDSSSDSASQEPPKIQKEGGFLVLVEPLINRGLDRLRSGIQALLDKYSDAPIDPFNIEPMLVQNLLGAMMWKLTRTMVLELNVARIEGQLLGETPEERYQSFLSLLRRPEFALELLREYPVLTRQLEVSIDHWVNYSLEFMSHLCADWKTVRDTLAPQEEIGQLVDIKCGAGDTHRQGRSVIIAKFSSGFQVVYKPHSLSVDIHFIELLEWLNARGDHAPFRTVKIIDRETYGWVEFVETGECASVEEINRFYERQGGYLALLYALEATDFHYENLIASGEHPVLVDLEALFHPRQGPTEHGDKVSSLIHDAMQHSVLRIGLLPQRIWINAESGGLDTSGLGGAPGQLTPYRILKAEAEGTDEMRMVRDRVEMPGSSNRPSLNGEDVNVQHYREAIVQGFTAIYQLLLKYRDELMADNGPLANFANDEVRAVLRPTKTYAMLLGEGFHPDVLRNALERDRLFDSLWVGIEQRPYMSRIIPAEQEDLQRGDIPLFASRPGSRHVWSSTNEVISDFFENSSLELVKHRLRELSEHDMSRQVWFIRASMTTLTEGQGHDQWSGYQATTSRAIPDRETLISMAKSVADRLKTMSVSDEETAVWVGVTLAHEKIWTLHPIGIDFYNGTPGIALFLSYLAAITKDEQYKTLAKAALETTKRQLEPAFSHPERLGGIGGFNGWGGIIYTLTHLGVLWNDPTMFAEAESFVEFLPELIAHDDHLDVMSGSAGCIMALLALYERISSKRVLEVARLCADRLVSTARQLETGIGWVTTIKSTQPLTGYSHGTAGMALALLKMAAVTGDERYRESALAAMAYERSLLSPEESNWPDFRILDKTAEEMTGKHDFMLAWCHGAPGIGLARLESLDQIDDSAIHLEINSALRATMNKGFGLNHCLCHGDLGNIELLLQARERLNDSEVSEVDDFINLTTASIVESINRYGWICGVPMGIETPGLMSGLAGIGYGLLRLAEPARVPSLLTLAPPIK
ncbi:MAG: type 2 lanthipeptide synthetase LanM family protein [Pyrinomonadaceae bacterium]